MGKLFRFLLVLVGLVLVASAVYAFTRSQKKQNGLKLVDAQVGSITEKAVAVGQIQPRQKFSVKSKISGIVRTCRVQVGDSVRTGDPLFEIAPDPTPLEQTEVDRRSTRHRPRSRGRGSTSSAPSSSRGRGSSRSPTSTAAASLTSWRRSRSKRPSRTGP